MLKNERVLAKGAREDRRGSGMMTRRDLRRHGGHLLDRGPRGLVVDTTTSNNLWSKDSVILHFDRYFF